MVENTITAGGEFDPTAGAGRETTPVRVLLVAPPSAGRRRLADRLTGDLEHAVVVSTGTADGALRWLDLEPFAGVVSAYELPDGTGLDLLRRLHAEMRDVPFVLLAPGEPLPITARDLELDVAGVVPSRHVFEEGVLAARIRARIDEAGTARPAEWPGRFVDASLAAVTAVLDAPTRADLEERLCEAFTSAGVGRAAWIVRDDDQLFVSSSAGPESLAAPDGVALDELEGAIRWALSTGEVQIADPRLGLVFLFPLRIDGDAVLGIHAAEEWMLDPVPRDLLSRVRTVLSDAYRTALRDRLPDDGLGSATATTLAVDEAGIGIVVYDADGRVEHANGAAAALLDRTADDLAGTDVRDLLPAIPGETVEDDGPSAAETGGQEAAEGRSVQAALDTGETRVQEVVLEREEGDTSAVIVTTPLGDGGESRTVALLVERAGRADSTAAFADVVAYEVGLRIETIHRALGHARETGEPYHLQKLEHALQRAVEIAEREREVVREGLAVRDPEPQRLNAVARVAWQHLSTPGADLQVRSSRDVLADREFLLRAFEHLFRHLVETAAPVLPPAEPSDEDAAVPAERRTERPRERRDAEPHDVDVTVPDEEAAMPAEGADQLTVVVSVLDDAIVLEATGPGVPLDLPEGAFDPPGSGRDADGDLGLGIVGRLVEAHGWTIEVEERPGDGIRFVIRDVAFA